MMNVRSSTAPASAAEAADEATLESVLTEVTEIFDRAKLEHVIFGGVASSALGRPRTTRDLDVLMRPDAAETALGLLHEHGFSTDRLDDKWIFKAQKDSVVVDLIFATRYGIHLDRDMLAHARQASFRGVPFHCIGREDLLLIKAVACDEASPRHWFDALGLIIGGKMNWSYLAERSNRAPRRVLSLLLYAQSIDYFVPRAVTRHLMSLCGEAASGLDTPIMERTECLE